MMKSWAGALLACAALLGGPALADAPPAGGYDGLYVFGDSLVDAGNVFLKTGGQLPPPASANGVDYVGGRFNNGATLADYLAEAITGHPATPSTLPASALGKPAVDYAYGYARVVTTGEVPITGTSASIDVPDLAQQLGSYAAASNRAADPNALYTLTFGGNDLFALAAMQPGSARDDYARQLITGYVGAVKSLEDIGAKHILVTGLPARDTSSRMLEATFEGALAQYEASDQPDATVTLYSLSGFFQTAQTDPGAVGLPSGLNFGTPCNAVPGASPTCAGYFYFDAQNGVGVHPTAQVDRAVYNQIAPLIGLQGAVPEPASWAELLLGFLFVGGTFRIARRPVTA